MITIASLKIPSGKPTDAVDTVNHNVFSRLRGQIRFLEPRSFRDIFRLLRRERPDFVLGLASAQEILILPFLPKNTRYVIAWHTLLRRTKAWPIRRRLFSRATFVIAVSECAASSIRKFFPEKNVFPALNGVDPRFFTPGKHNPEYLSKKFKLDFSRPVVLFVGALFHRKRPELFLEISRRVPEANFVLVGRAAEVKLPRILPDNFRWIPAMSREDVAMLMATSQIFLFPSVNEPCAAVIPEALASGLPVILSKSCGNSELITDNKEGFLVPVGDQEIAAMAEKVRYLIADSGARQAMSGRAREKCLKELNWEVVAKKYLEIFAPLNPKITDSRPAKAGI